VARDGTSNLIYIKNVNNTAHVFVSRLLRGSFRTPQQIDPGLAGPSSQPVIAAGNGGVLLLAFVNGGALYVVQTLGASQGFSGPAGLIGGASNPSLRRPRRVLGSRRLGARIDAVERRPGG
jgi:hypothetical protein